APGSAGPGGSLPQLPGQRRLHLVRGVAGRPILAELCAWHHLVLPAHAERRGGDRAAPFQRLAQHPAL
ncbi:unnamed protein product, partial [Effrenium voratum]